MSHLNGKKRKNPIGARGPQTKKSPLAKKVCGKQGWMHKWQGSTCPGISLFWVPFWRHTAWADLLLYYTIKLFLFYKIGYLRLFCRKYRVDPEERGILYEHECVREESEGAAIASLEPSALKGLRPQQLQSWVIVPLPELHNAGAVSSSLTCPPALFLLKF